MNLRRTTIRNRDSLVSPNKVLHQLGIGYFDEVVSEHLSSVTIPAAIMEAEKISKLSIFDSTWEYVTETDIGIEPILLRRSPTRCIKSVQYRTSSCCTCWTDVDLEDLCIEIVGIGDVNTHKICKKSAWGCCSCCVGSSSCRMHETKIVYESGFQTSDDLPPDLFRGILMLSQWMYYGGDDELYSAAKQLCSSHAVYFAPEVTRPTRPSQY